MNKQRVPGRVDINEPQPPPQPQETRRRPGRVEEAVVAVAEENPATGPLTTAGTGSSLWRTTLWLVLLGISCWILLKTAFAIVQLWQDYWWLASGLAVLAAVTLLCLLRLIFVEWRARKRLDEVQIRQQQFARARQTEDMQLYNNQLAAIGRQLDELYPQQMADFKQAQQQRETVAARMQLAENSWLAQLDQQAEKLIKQEAIGVGAAVALVPHPVLDALVVLWRSQRLVRQLGQLYGWQPTGLSSWALLKTALFNTMLVGALDTASELFAEQAGYSMMETAVGKGAVQGVVIGQRMRRLGMQAQQLCRPWQKMAEKE